jgi:hypothetical protein
MSFVSRLHLRMRAMLLAVSVATLGWSGAGAQGAVSFDAAWHDTSADYQAAMRTLDTQSQDETTAAVQRLRRSFQRLADSFSADQPPHLAGDAAWPGEFMQIDVRLVGALLVIQMGSREGARKSLAPLGETLARLRTPASPAR